MRHVIVGAGTAGCVLAARLTEDPSCEVVLLEAGPRDATVEVRIPAAFTRLFGTARDWSYRTTPQRGLDGRTIHFPRGRMLGGTSGMNAQIWTRGHPEDFDGWQKQGASGWSHADVVPFFQRAEGFLEPPDSSFGRGGPITISPPRSPNPMSGAFLEGVRQAGIPLTGADLPAASQGAGWFALTQRRGRRWSAADAYLRPVLERSNLNVITGAHVTRIRIDGSRATGVDYVVNGESRHASIAGDGEVVLSAGAINSPQLLMLSGVGEPSALARHGVAAVHELPGVGAGLMDHLTAGVIQWIRKPISLLAGRGVGSMVRWMLSGRGPLTSSVAEAVAFVRTLPGTGAPDLEILFAPVMFVEEGLAEPPGHGMTAAAVVLLPESRGSVSLASRDPFAAPLIDTGFLTDDAGADLDLLVRGVRMSRSILASSAFDSYRGDEHVPGADAVDDAKIAAGIRTYAQTLYHPACTCRMGIDEAAVCDQEMRVRGLEGLRVVDASAMPVLVRAHPNAAITMMAERAASWMRR